MNIHHSFNPPCCFSFRDENKNNKNHASWRRKLKSQVNNGSSSREDERDRQKGKTTRNMRNAMKIFAHQFRDEINFLFVRVALVWGGKNRKYKVSKCLVNHCRLSTTQSPNHPWNWIIPLGFNSHSASLDRFVSSSFSLKTNLLSARVVGSRARVMAAP